MIAKLEGFNRTIDAEIAAKVEKIKENQDVKAKSVSEKISAQKSISQPLMKNAFKFFEKKSEEVMVWCFESLIGILRGTGSADNYSVELYLKKYEGFTMGVNRVDFKASDPKNAEFILQAYKDKYIHLLKDNPQYDEFKPFFNLLVRMCMLILYANDEKTLEDSIKRKHEKQAINMKEIDQKKDILENLNFHIELQEELNQYRDEKLPHFLKAQEFTKQQIDRITKQLDGFETHYFQDL